MTEDQPIVDWESIVQSIREHACVLMLGPDAVTEPTDGGNVSLMQLFSKDLMKELNSDQFRGTKLDPFQVAQVFKDLNDARRLRIAAKNFFEHRRDKTAAALRELAVLPFKLVIDTTPLNQMEHAFREQGVEPVEEWYQSRAKPRLLNAEFTPKNPLVYHIFGSTRELMSLVLAENDLLDLLVCVIEGNPRLPDRLKNFFDAETMMLFLGFGVRHFSLRILLHILSSGKTKNRSFALERFDDEIDRRFVEGTKLMFQQGQRIDFIDMELDAFTKELRQRCEPHLESGAVSTRFLGGPSPQVFLSYCHEDAEQANRIRKHLESKQIRIWMDSETLRAGEVWDDEIERVIRKDAQYFIIVNTATLAQRREGVVFRELKLARNRQEQFKAGGVFVCPVLADGAPLLGELEPYHAIDITSENGLAKLASHLKRDFEQRKKTIL